MAKEKVKVENETVNETVSNENDLKFSELLSNDEISDVEKIKELKKMCNETESEDPEFLKFKAVIFNPAENETHKIKQILKMIENQQQS